MDNLVTITHYAFAKSMSYKTSDDKHIKTLVEED
jgi:hypothetical protein